MSEKENRTPRLARALAWTAAALGCWMAGCNHDSPPTDAKPDAPIFLSEAAPGNSYASHSNLFAKGRFPSAYQCGKCHPVQFRQWSVSQHSYAQLSPIFNAMQGKIDKGVNGTNGDFCVRCHTQVGMTLGERVFMSNIDRSSVSREGVTCIVCHRLAEPMGKVSGRLPISDGGITDPIYGPTGRNSELEKAIAAEDLSTAPHVSGRKVHGELRRFFRISTSNFCSSCHDVTLFNGFRIEEAFSEYRHSPAAARGVLCQDCHMGKEPGRILAEKSNPNFERLNYAFGPAAEVGDYLTAPRKLTNHMFVGPDYPVVPPWLFPHHRGAIRDEKETTGPAARGLATIRQWMQFDWKAGWGAEAFEAAHANDVKFPKHWAAADDRRAARQIIDDNLALLAEMSQQRLKLLRNGYRLGDVVTRSAGPSGIAFAVQVKSGTDGHGVPTGFDVERLVWLHVTVRDAAGRVVQESGDLDCNGDVRDRQSSCVRKGQVPLDEQLFSLQGHFIVHLQHGAEREQVLSTNYSPSPLPFLRPARMSSILLGRPLGARKQKENIEPLGERWAEYSIDPSHLTGRPPYVATVQLKAAMVPVNLVNEVRGVGFDYNLSAAEISKNLIAGHRVVWEKRVTLQP